MEMQANKQIIHIIIYCSLFGGENISLLMKYFM